MALEESKKEADRVKHQTTSQWSTVARQTSSTQQSANQATKSATATPVKPKPAPIATPAAANSSPQVSLPGRSVTNPWGTQASGTSNTYSSVVSASKPVESSAAPVVAPTATNVQTTTNSAAAAPGVSYAAAAAASTQSTPREDEEEEEEEFDDEEMVLVPITVRAPSPAAAPTPVKPIARPTSTTQSHTSTNDSYNSYNHNSEPNDGIYSHLDTSRTSGHNYDATSSATMSTSTLSSGLSSPAPQTPSNVTQQLQDALSRIAKLEQDNQFIVNRMSRILEASVHLEQTVSTIAAENVQLKAQVADLNSQVKVLSAASNSSQSNTQGSDPNSTILSPQYFQPFFSMPPYGGQSMGMPYGAAPTHMNAPHTTNGYLG